MTFFLDESISLYTNKILNQSGFKSKHTIEVGLKGRADDKIANYALTNNLILITKDLEFGNYQLYPKGNHYGLIIIRFPTHMKKEDLTNKLILFLKNIKTEELIHSVTIVEIGKYRIRRF
jgi:predicted nuclease of predicted toxin-antitoxin system